MPVTGSSFAFNCCSVHDSVILLSVRNPECEEDGVEMGMEMSGAVDWNCSPDIIVAASCRSLLGCAPFLLAYSRLRPPSPFRKVD